MVIPGLMIQTGDIHFTVKTPVGVTEITISSLHHIFFSNPQRSLTANFLRNNKVLISSRFPNPNEYIGQISLLPWFFLKKNKKKFSLRANIVDECSIKFSVFWRSLLDRQCEWRGFSFASFIFDLSK